MKKQWACAEFGDCDGCAVIGFGVRCLACRRLRGNPAPAFRWRRPSKRLISRASPRASSTSPRIRTTKTPACSPILRTALARRWPSDDHARTGRPECRRPRAGWSAGRDSHDGAARRGNRYGVHQFFTRAVDTGFSKSPEWTMKIWGDQLPDGRYGARDSHLPSASGDQWLGRHAQRTWAASSQRTSDSAGGRGMLPIPRNFPIRFAKDCLRGRFRSNFGLQIRDLVQRAPAVLLVVEQRRTRWRWWARRGGCNGRDGGPGGGGGADGGGGGGGEARHRSPAYRCLRATFRRSGESAMWRWARKAEAITFRRERLRFSARDSAGGNSSLAVEKGDAAAGLFDPMLLHESISITRVRVSPACNP